MRTTIILFVISLGYFSVALADDADVTTFSAVPLAYVPDTNTAPNYVLAPPSVTTNTISATDVVSDSIRLLRLSTNSFVVRWTYTEGGAKKALASWETNAAHHAMSVQWKEGWLKHRTDKGFFKTEEAARAYMDKLKVK